MAVESKMGTPKWVALRLMTIFKVVLRRTQVLRSPVTKMGVAQIDELGF